MRWNIGMFLKKLSRTLIFALAALPMAILLLAQLAPQAIGTAFALTAAYAAAALFCLCIGGKKRIAAGIMCAAGLTALGIVLLPVRENALVLLLLAGFAALLFYSLQTAAWPEEKGPAFSWLAIGLLAHAIAQAAVDIDRRMASGIYAPIENALFFSFMLFLLLALLSFNRSSMNEASLSRQRVPQAMRRRNVMLTAGFFALVALIAAIPMIGRALEAVWEGVLAALRAFAVWLALLFPQEEAAYSSSGGAQAAMMGMGAVEEPGLLVRVLEKIAFAVAGVIFVILAIFVLGKTALALRRLWRWLSERLRLFAAATSEDYVDEVSDTRDAQSTQRGGLAGRLRRRWSFADEKRMSPAERIRYRYLRLLLRHPQWRESSTARENLNADAAALYERARYSRHEMRREDAEAFEKSV